MVMIIVIVIILIIIILIIQIMIMIIGIYQGEPLVSHYLSNAGFLQIS